MNRIKVLPSLTSLVPLACSKPAAESGAVLKRLLFALSILMSQTGCGAIANQAVPPPWLVGAECSQDSTEVEEQTFAINVVMSVLAGALVFSGGQCDGHCSGYEGMVELAIGVTGLGAGFIYTANEREFGRDNANNCVEYMKTLQVELEKIAPNPTTIKTKSSVETATSDADNSEMIQKSSMQEREPTAILPLRDSSSK